MQPDSRKLLWDALQAAERVVRFLEARNFEDYRRDEQLRSAVERQLEVVGEALARLRKGDPETAATIPELPRIIAFRNILVHGYATVDDMLVWGVIEVHLPGLRAQLRALLGEEHPG